MSVRVQNKRRHVILCADQPDVERALFERLHRFEGRGLAGDGKLDMRVWRIRAVGRGAGHICTASQKRRWKDVPCRALEALQLFFALGDRLESVFLPGQTGFARFRQGNTAEGGKKASCQDSVQAWRSP